MSTLKFKLFGKQIEIKNQTSESCIRTWAGFLSGHVPVTASTALKVAAVLRCCDVVAKTMASLPLNLFRDTKDGHEKAVNHPLYPLLYRLPNPQTTAYEFWHMFVFSLMLTRGAYAKIERNAYGGVVGLWNIPTANCSIIQTNSVNGERYINVSLPDGKLEPLREGDFMYVPSLRFNSAVNAENPISIAADVLGLTIALNSFASDYFKNGSNLGGVVEHPGTMSDESYARFKESWQTAYSGAINQHRIAFLEEGLKFIPLGRDPEKSQALESRQFQVLEICRVMGVPPHKVFDLSRATFSNIEQQNIEYVQESIAPMAVKIEQAIYRDLLTAREQKEYFAKFQVNALMRGDIAARSAFYNQMHQNGIFSANDIRELEDMNKIPADQGGDAYLVNGNMISRANAVNSLPKSMRKE